MREIKTNRKIWIFMMAHLAAWVIAMSIMPGAKWILKSIYHSTPFLYKQLAIKGILLFGFVAYLFWVLWKACEDLNTLCYDSESEYGDRKPTNNFLWVLFFSVLTLGIYGVYWAWQQGERLHDTAVYYYKLDIKEDGNRCLVYAILGYVTLGLLNFIFFMTLLKNLNRVAEVYNRGNEYLKEEEKRKQRWEKGETGESVIVVSPEKLEVPETIVPQMGSLKLLTGAYAGAVIPFAAHTEVVLGNSKEYAHIVMEDALISEKHCGICYQPEKNNYVLIDYSDTGIFLADGSAIEKETPVQVERGTVFMIAEGKYEFLLQ